MAGTQPGSASTGRPTGARSRRHGHPAEGVRRLALRRLPDARRRRVPRRAHRPSTDGAHRRERAAARAGRPAPVVGTPDLDDVDRQADEIIAAGSRRGGADRRGGDAHAAVLPAGDRRSRPAAATARRSNAFLAQEREFLQEPGGARPGPRRGGEGRWRRSARSAPAAVAPAAPRSPRRRPRGACRRRAGGRTPAAEAPAGGAHVAAQDRARRTVPTTAAPTTPGDEPDP